MLILARKPGQKVIIGEPDKREVEIVMLGFDPRTNQAKLGFAADKSIKINREEIYEKMAEGKNKDPADDDFDDDEE